MVPRTLQRQLDRLRRRERLLRLSWAAARCLALFSVVLAVACAVDFTVDLSRDTPRWLRVLLLAFQMALWLTGGVLLLRVLLKRLSDTEVTLWIEDRYPELGHRLISAVQLNREGAKTAGMSPELIAQVTRQAEEQAADADFSRVADARRLKWTAQLLAPLLLAVVLLLILWPDTVQALLARQLLQDQPIPRSLALESVRDQQVWPTGEEGVLRFRVRGAFAEHLRGEVRLDLPDGDSERHELLFESADESGAIFAARVRPLTRDFSYRAWLKDGRTHESAEVHFEPRPLVLRQQAWVQLPRSLGVKPSGQRFEEPQKGADLVYRLAGSTARIVLETQKPIVKATVEVLGPPHAFAETTRPGGRAATVRRSIDLDVRGDGCTAEGVFSIQSSLRPELLSMLAVGFAPGAPVGLPWAGLMLAASGEVMQTETAYRLVVRDAFDLENQDKPRRNIRSVPVEPPEVALLPETLSPRNAPPSEDDEIEGIPLLLGQRVPIAYECRSTYGLSHARLRYRVIPRTSSRDDGGEPIADEFLPLPLGAARGQTSKPSKKAQEEFFVVPSNDPDRLGGTEGGGRYDFDSTGIPDGKGGLLRLQEGDRIQFYVEVFGRSDPDGVPGRSALREKEVVSQKDFWAWIERKEDHKERIRKLEENQRGLAGIVSLLPEERPRLPEHSGPHRPLPNDSLNNLPEGDTVLGRSWQLLGPFANDKDAGHARSFPPETEVTDLSKSYDGLKGKVRWQLHHSENDKVDLQSIFNHGEAGVAYAVCWIRPAAPMRVLLATGSDDGIKVWINRKLVLDRAVHREAIPADDKTPLTLEASWQEVIVKVDNRFGTWAFYFDFLDIATGKSVSPRRIHVRTTPLTLVENKTFIKDWLVLGPFVDTRGDGHTRVFPPERDPLDPKREYDGPKGKIRWKEHHSKEARIDLIDACSIRAQDGRNGVAYALCWVKSDKGGLVYLATGSDDGIRVWINRRLIHDRAGTRSAEPNSERTPILLAKGWNEMLVKVDNKVDSWAFYLELLDTSTGTAATGLQFQTTPPEKKR